MTKKTKKKKKNPHHEQPDLSRVETRHGELHPGCDVSGGASTPIPDRPTVEPLCTPVQSVSTTWN